MRPARRPGARGAKGLCAAAALAVVASASPSVYAEADGPDRYRVRGVAVGGTLNLRAEPSSAAKRLARIPADATCLRNLGCRGGLTFEEFTTLAEPEKSRRAAQNPRWCKVDYRGTVGWVLGRYVAEDGCATAPAPEVRR